MRSMEEMLKDALHLRNQAIDEGRDPAEVIFPVTVEEHCLMLAMPRNTVTLNQERDRFIGMKVEPLKTLQRDTEHPRLFEKRDSVL